MLFRSALLDDSGASVRFVDRVDDRTLDREKIGRARARVDVVDIRDREDNHVVGRILGIEPLSKKFGMELHPSGELIRGSVSNAYSTEYLQQLAREPGELIAGKLWVTRMRIRETHEPNRPARRTYFLLGLISTVDPE